MQIRSRQFVLTVLLSLAVVATVAFMLRPKPMRLVLLGGSKSDTVVINKTLATQLTALVFDQYGRQMRIDSAAQFQKLEGDVEVSPGGVVTCARNEDAILRATSMRLEKKFVLHCRPVVWLEALSWLDFVVGDTPRDLSFTAHGVDGRPVTELRGSISLLDGSIAEVVGTAVRAKKPGRTAAVVEVGDQTAMIAIQVYRPVTSFVNNPRKEDLMAMHVSLARGDTIEVLLPKAAFWVKYFSTDRGAAPPTIELLENGACTTGDGLRARRVEEGVYTKYCLTRDHATMMIAHGSVGADTVKGTVALQIAW
jgi:hypothetical protein